MPLKPSTHCLCCRVYICCKLICVYEILRVCITGFILIIHAVTEGMSFLLFHYIFRNPQSVSILFSYLSIHAIRTFTCLNTREPYWQVLRTYFKLKIAISLIWSAEITGALIIIKSLYSSESIPMSMIVLSYFGAALDLYFAFLIYSCMKLGEMGTLVTSTLPTSVQNMGTQPNDDVYVAREFKEVMAYPARPIPQECEVVVVYDFTNGKTDDN